MPDMPTSIVIHGHFYQPPRENPWTGAVEREPSAHPFRDWNERIHKECYRANAFARVFDAHGRVERIVDNYRHISFNFGPTLLAWMEPRHAPTYARVIEADRESARRRGGHGNAIAQGYNHAILPLCNERDRRTQVRWGIADFKHRFGRDPESLWLPETACNDATLETLIEEGLKFVILAPSQAERVRPLGPRGARAPGQAPWKDVSDGSVDPGVAYRFFHRDGSGRSIAIFFYDGPIARAIAFEGALSSSQVLMDRLERAQGGDGRLIHVATDGESYGHHFTFGDRALAYALEFEAPRRGFEVTNYGAFLEAHPPAFEVELKKGDGGLGTAWSCAHGVSRWYRDCGCRTGGREGWSQAWRGPLRSALDLLRDEVARAFEEQGGELLRDPWAARDEYIRLVLDRSASREEFLRRHAGRHLREREQVRALTFLELARNAMVMYTSCGFFFADISGIETVQILKYAGRALDLMDDLGLPSPRERFLEVLAAARSNLPEMGSGADVYRRFVDPARVSAEGVAAHLAISTLVGDDAPRGETGGYAFERADHDVRTHGRITLATGRLTLDAVATERQLEYAFAAMHFGGVDFYCVLKPFPGGTAFRRSANRLWADFRTASLPTMLRLAQEEFGPDEYGLEHVLPEGRERISGIIFGDLVKRLSEQYARLYEDNRRSIEMLHEVGFDLPPELRAAAEFTLTRRFAEEIRRQGSSRDPAAYEAAIEIAEEVARRGYRIDRSEASRLFGDMVTDAVRLLVAEPSEENRRSALALLGLTRRLGLEIDVDRAQEAVFAALSGPGGRPELGEIARELGLAPAAAERAGPVQAA
jgi:alpha-amylase/alpha-mannosidase (GH57 family)